MEKRFLKQRETNNSRVDLDHWWLAAMPRYRIACLNRVKWFIGEQSYRYRSRVRSWL